MISINHVSHTYNKKMNQLILHDVSLEIPDGKFAMLLGQSGSGKTTLLNIIAGLMKPTKGEVFWNNYIIRQLMNFANTDITILDLFSKIIFLKIVILQVKMYLFHFC